jgi:hypothetical protein
MKTLLKNKIVGTLLLKQEAQEGEFFQPDAFRANKVLLKHQELFCGEGKKDSEKLTFFQAEA